LRPIEIPLSGWAQSLLDEMVAINPEFSALSAQELLQERAQGTAQMCEPLKSAKGGTGFYRAKDGWVALNLARQQDVELLPALFGDVNYGSVSAACMERREADLVARGRLLGMAIAGLNEETRSPALVRTALGLPSQAKNWRVLDLSALWAGPLASRLLLQCGFNVIRIESEGRKDPTQFGDPAHFDALNRGKKTITIDIRTEAGQAELLALISRADIVIEAARPRALLQLGIDANNLVRQQAGLTWLTITGHGIEGESGEWVAFGDDAAVAGGLSRELQEATGLIGFVGDAIADPMTGIAAAHAALVQASSGGGARLVLSMSGIVHEAIEATKAKSLSAWKRSLHDVAGRTGQREAAIAGASMVAAP